MSTPVVLVARDSVGNIEVRWYLDLAEWDAGRHLALVSSRELWVDGEADHEVRRIANRLSENEFEASSRPDVQWLATHIQAVAGDHPEPIAGRAA